MEAEGLNTKIDGRKTRKKSSRSSGKRGPASPASKRLKELWADPEWRAKHTEINRRIIRERAERGTDRHRFGVPDGMRKKEAQRRWAKAERSAKKTMAELKETKALDGLDEKAEEALTSAIAVMRSPSNQTVKLAAARLVLDFTKAKPASKSEITLNKAEAWLKQIAADNDADEEDDNTSGDA